MTTPRVLVLAAGPLQGRVAEVLAVSGPPYRYQVILGGAIQGDLPEDRLADPPKRDAA